MQAVREVLSITATGLQEARLQTKEGTGAKGPFLLSEDLEDWGPGVSSKLQLKTHTTLFVQPMS